MWHNYKRLLPFAKPFKWLFLLSVLFNIITAFASSVVFAALIPAMSVLIGDVHPQASPAGGGMQPMNLLSKSSILDAFRAFFLEGSKTEALSRICIFIFFLYLAKNVFQYLGNYVMSLVEGGINKYLRDTVFEKLSNLSLDYYYDRKMGNILLRVTDDVGVVNSMLTSSLTTLVREPLQIVAILYVLFTLNPQMMAVAFGIALSSLLLINVMGKSLKLYAHRVQERIGGFMSVAQEMISAIKVVKSFGMESYEVSRFKDETKNHYAFSRRLTRIRQTVGPMNEMLAIGGFIGILWFGGNQVFNGQMKGSELLFFLIALPWLMQPVRTLSEVIGRLHEGAAASENIYTVLDAVPSVPSGFRDAPIDPQLPIYFNNVRFRYKNSPKDALNGISLEINPKEVVALVGPSGAGKTTFVDLLARFYDVSEGQIVFEGHNIKDYSLSSLKKLFGIVTQDTVLFHDTLFNNIAYGNKSANQEMVIEAAKAANAHEFILETPNGYNTIAGDRGVRLSGGQRQRIAIARALLKNPPILIFDEATSALDSESEQLVQQAIERLLANRTAIVIAHRLSTIQNADRIVVFENGSIVEIGTHKELLSIDDGVYRKLHELQSQNKSENLAEV